MFNEGKHQDFAESGVLEMSPAKRETRKMKPEEIKNKKVSVIGGKRSGLAASRLLRSHGAKVFLSDAREPKDNVIKGELEKGKIAFEFGGHTEKVFDCDFVVVSPGVPSNSPIVKKLAGLKVPIYSEVELASWFCKARIVAITGTDGKTTTTLLTHRICENAGRKSGFKAFALGNVGTPFSDYVDEMTEQDIAVVETSSFQLDYIHAFRPKVAVITNITPDHLDRYEYSFNNYANAKFRIYKNQTPEDFLIYNYDDEFLRGFFEIQKIKPRVVPLSVKENLDKKFADCGYFENGKLITKFDNQKEEVIRMDEIKIRGTHNLYNSLAAALASRALEIRKDVIRESMMSFEGVPHRLEMVRDVQGVEFINDSKATTVNALWYALDTMTRPVILIAGGRDKGNDYSKVKSLVKQKVKLVVAIGESADKVEASFANTTKVIKVKTMDEAVKKSRKAAEEGDVVLLSPACASFDMFDDFEQRGEVFKRLVGNLE
jgi:UDP-N-acetylmuramoylalanine--D-glutamate ligase